MFERFTDRARRVVVLAQEEARMLNHNYIGTEHILLGLIQEGEGVAAQCLESLGISLEAVRAQVREIIGEGKSTPSGHIPFTPRAKKVLELSLREALHLQHDYIGTEHILLGLIREGEGVAAQVLQKLGADHARTRQKVLEVLSGQSGLGPTIETTEVAERLARVEEVERRAVDVAAEFESDEVEPEHHWIAALRLNLEQMEEAVEAYRTKLRNAERRLTDRKKGRQRKPKGSQAAEDQPD
jgi:hypothetical protein